MLAQPRWFYDATTNTMVINLISSQQQREYITVGHGTVQMELGDPDYCGF